MATNFPGSVDNASTVGDGTHPSADELLSSTDGGPAHHALHQNVGLAINAIEDKLGVGASTPVVGSVLTGTGSGESEWSTNPLSVDATNSRVGIGTTSPTTALDVRSFAGNLSSGNVGGGTKGTLFLQNSGGTKGDGELSAGVAFSGTDTGRRRAMIAAFQDGTDGDPHGLQFFTYGSTSTASDAVTSRMTIGSDGKVGIGTTSPGEMLEIGSASNYGSLRVHAWKGSESFRVTQNIVRSASINQLTTSSSANVFINTSNNTLYRSTVSALKYKTDVETMEDKYADAILGLRPVWYRSLCEADPDSYGYWGFIAEEVAEVDPRLVNFGVPDDYVYEYDADGEMIDPAVEDLTEPEGVQYDRFVPHLVNLLARQRDQIADLSARVATLEAA